MKKTLIYFIILLAMLIVSITLFTPIPASLKLPVRIIFVVTFFTLWRWFDKKGMPEFKNLSFILFVLNVAFLIVSPFTTEFWGLDADTAKGFALSKLSDSAIISFLLIISFILGRYKLKSIFLTQGRLIPGLLTGIVFFIVSGYLAVNNPDARMEPAFLQKNYMWILVFVFANSFMEELIFRGIFLNTLNGLFKPVWSIVLTSVCFAAPHLTVNYSPNVLIFSGIVFILGMICGIAIHYTRSLIAPVLIHAGADMLIIVPVFASYGVNG